MASFRRRGCTCKKKRCTCGAKWQYRINHVDPLSNKRIEVSKGGFKTKSEAEKAALDHENKLKNGEAVVTTKMNTAQFFDYWLKEFKEGNVAKNTYILHKNSVKNHIVPYFKDTKLANITPQMYHQFLRSLVKNGKSRRTIEIIHNSMFIALEVAVDPLKMINTNPAKNAKIPLENKKQGVKVQFLDSSKVNAFLNEARKDNWIYYIFFKTLIRTGLRKGEAASLQWSDIDLENKIISVNKTLDFQAKVDEPLLTPTKTEKSNRIIDIDADLVEDLKKQKQIVEENKEVFNDIYHHDYDFVFCRNDGSFLPKSTLFNALKRILKKMGEDNLPIHALRHTHAVMMLEAGARMKNIQERLGHQSMEITADIYSHVSEKIKNDDMNLYEEYLKNLS